MRQRLVFLRLLVPGRPGRQIIHLFRDEDLGHIHETVRSGDRAQGRMKRRVDMQEPNLLKCEPGRWLLLLT